MPTAARTPSAVLTCAGDQAPICDLKTQPSEDQVRGAMQSIAFYANGGDSTAVGASLRPMTLDRAVCVLLRDNGENHAARKRLAFILLFAGLKPAPNEVTGHTDLGPPSFCSAIRALGPLDQILGSDEFHIENFPSHERLAIENRVRDELMRINGALNTDCATLNSCRLVQDPSGAEGVEFSISARKSLNDVKQAIDPQAWALCSSASFKATYVTELSLKGTPIFEHGPCEPKEASNKPPRGSDYERPLFEDYVFNPCGGDDGCPPGLTKFGASFENILSIKAKNGTDAASGQPNYVMTYNLNTSKCSTVLGKKQPGVITTDYGQVVAIAAPSPTPTEMTGTKFIQFVAGGVDPGFNGWAKYVLPLLCEEAAGVSGGGVCCTK